MVESKKLLTSLINSWHSGGVFPSKSRAPSRCPRVKKETAVLFNIYGHNNYYRCSDLDCYIECGKKVSR